MANAKDSGIEYTIMTLDGETKSWSSQGMTNEMDAALANAEKFLATGKYEKVEIKQKYFDKKANRQVEGTLKTLDYKKPSGILPIIGLLFLAIAAGGGSFAAAYFLTKEDKPAAEESAAGEHAAAPEKSHGEEKPAH
jgi:hypothetical protein